jgi:predicted ATPase
VVTFLFTDVEGSTRRWETDADGMRKALAAHDEVLRAAIDAHGGFLFKHTGDGVCAVFSSPRSAVDAAVTAQRGLELPVRMGLATGEAELRDGDYFGAVLNRASRVMAAGHGGQVLLAESTAGLLSGIDLLNLGPRRLRDVSAPVGVFQVRAPGLRTDFPPLRTLDPTPGNLRRAATSFIGRESEVAEVEAALRAHRLVTLTGVGGVGKTRLATEVAARLGDGFPHGVWFFELAAVTDPASVPDAVAAVLGITQQPGSSVSDSVAAALEGRLRLLVFDNCEHVLDAAGDLIEAILAQSATAKILATSREGLGVVDEHLWPVPSLGVGPGIDSSAVTLFRERAQAVAPHFSIVNEADAVVEICGRLDGIPLAIELAASRMASMTASEVRDRLGHRFRLLVGSRRGLQRHHTLRHAVAWSYDLLDKDEKSLLDRCSVFAGGFDLQSACAVAGFDDSDDYALLDLLDSLVRKSLLVADRSSERTRFSMLETIREFAEEQLVAHGEATAARTAHARYFAGRETDIMALWDSPRQREAYAWFTLELANLRSAFRFAADHGDLDTAITVAVYAPLLGIWLEQYEPSAWAEEVIEAAKVVEHHRLAQLYVAAAMCYASGRIDDAIDYTEAGLVVLESGRFDQPSHDSESWLGGVYLAKGSPERWVEVCRNAFKRSHSAFSRAFLVVALTMTGADEEAIALSDGLVAAADATTNPCRACYILLADGIARRKVDPAAAYEAHRRGLQIAQDSGNRFAESYHAANLARLAATHAEAMDALGFITVTIRNYRDSGSLSMLPGALAVLATFFDRIEHYQPAATINGFAATPFTRTTYPEFNATIAHLREALGDQTYESLAREGEAMTTAEMVAYAFDQIDQARAQLNAVSE